MTSLMYLFLLPLIALSSALVLNGASNLHRHSCLSTITKNCLKASMNSEESDKTKAKVKKSASKSKAGAETKTEKMPQIIKESKAKVKVDKPKEVMFRKLDFINKMAIKTGMTKAESETALSSVLEIITEEVSAGKRVAMMGFGTFKLNQREARKGRNPKTGEAMDIAASKYPSFVAGKSFKESCNI